MFVDLPEPGKQFALSESVCAIESVKTAADVYAPVVGKVVAVNDKLSSEPQQVSIGAENEGWLVKVKVSDEKALASLMDQNAYQEFLKTLDH